MVGILVSILFTVSSFSSFAQSDAALLQTQELLKDPTKRNEFINSDAKAREADLNLKNLAGSEKNAEAVYGISADLFKAIHDSAGGDAAKIQEIIQKISQNPEEMKKYLSPETYQKLQNSAKAIESQQQKRP